jgi:hypothetical protein
MVIVKEDDVSIEVVGLNFERRYVCAHMGSLNSQFYLKENKAMNCYPVLAPHKEKKINK